MGIQRYKHTDTFILSSSLHTKYFRFFVSKIFISLKQIIPYASKLVIMLEIIH